MRPHEAVTIKMNKVVRIVSYPYLRFPGDIGCPLPEVTLSEECRHINPSGLGACHRFLKQRMALRSQRIGRVDGFNKQKPIFRW